MLISSHCHMGEQDIGFIKEIQKRQRPVEVWAYGLMQSQAMGTMAFEMAIRQDHCWYEVFERLVTINDEEYPRIQVIKHDEQSVSEFPFSPYERIYQSHLKQKEVEWVKIATIYPPFTLWIFQDTFRTWNVNRDGMQTLRDKCADIAIGFKSAVAEMLFQIIDHPYFLKICCTEEDLDDIRELWQYHITEDEEAEQMRLEGVEDYYHCQILKESCRIKRKIGTDTFCCERGEC